MQIAMLLKGNRRSAITLPTEAGLDQAIKCMHRANVTAVMIMDNDRVRGILTRSDILRGLVRTSGTQPEKIAVKEIMSPNPISASPDELVHTALASMRSDGIGHLPVMDQGTLTGLLHIADLLHHQNLEQQREINLLQEYIHNMQNAEYD
jgi:CBS domain-containing protein